MKKVWKALMAVFATVAMALTGFAGATSAFAANGYTLTINNATTGHTYEAYQVFSGTLSNDGKLSNITWGNGVNSAVVLEALKTNTAFGDGDANAFKDVTDASGVAEKLATYHTDSTEAKAFAKVVGAHLTAAAGTSTEAENKYTISNLSAGYYLVKDKDNSVPEGQDAYTDFILKIVKDTAATPKSAVPTVEKKVKDTNDSTGDTSKWQDSADHDINDVIDYQLTGTLPSNYDSFGSYAYTFTDTLSKGLTVNKDSIRVYAVNGTTETEITGDYTTNVAKVTAGTTAPYDDGHVLTVAFANLKTATTAATINANTKIVVRYTATLNANAIIGSAGNPNKVDLTFSNNPNGEGTGKTPEDMVIVFTFKTIVNKVNQDSKPLAGAKFKLEKKIKGKDGAEDTWQLIGEKTATGNGSNVFTWEGLDDGDYRLTETVTPDGYNTIDPIEFTITAKHDALSDNPGLTQLNGNVASGQITFTTNTTTGSLTTNVVNKQGSTLPETGGMGTVVLYVAGAALVLAAGLWFGLRRRNRSR